MNPSQIANQLQVRCDQVLTHFQEELKKLRTGRANPGMLEGVVVESYGSSMPLNQVASITAPEAQLLQITPYDPNNLVAISSAIRDNQTLGFNPMDDGRVVRVSVPPLTTERRQQIVKQLNEKMEESMISLRTARHEALKEADQAKKDKLMSEDDYKRLQKQVDELITSAKNSINALAETKQAEIMTV